VADLLNAFSRLMLAIGAEEVGASMLSNALRSKPHLHRSMFVSQMDFDMCSQPQVKAT
jgi:hypothetical protein